MANPTRAQIQSQWSDAIELLDYLRRTGNSGGYPAGNASNLLSKLNTLQSGYLGDWLDEAENAAEGIRSGLANLLSPGTIAAVHRPFLKQYCKSVIGRTDLSSDTEMWQEMYKYFIDNALRVQSRAFTFGTPTAGGSNTGNGQILRLTKDRYNFDIESGHVDSKRAICVTDENTGARRGQESFILKGQASTRDELERSGSGLSGSLVGLTLDDSLLTNPGFRSPGTSPTSLTGWTASAGDGASYYTLNTTTYFRRGPSEVAAGSTPGALQLLLSNTLTQKLTVRGTQLNENTPYLLAVVWNRNGSSGTLNLRMGSITTTVAVAAQSGWNVTTVPNPIGQSCWYRQFAQADMQIQLEWIQSTANLLISEVLLVPGTFFDGSWYWALPASTATYAQWRVRDDFTWPDIATGSAKNQTWIHRGFPGMYLPHANGSSITWADA